MAKPPDTTTTTPPAEPSKVIDPRGFDFNAFDAQAAQESVRAGEMFEILTEQLAIGSFRYVPQALKDANYHFVCVGTKGDPRSEENAQRFRGYGYINAPSMVRCVGREKEGDRSLILCARPEAHARLRDAKIARMRRRHERLSRGNVQRIEEQLRDGMRSGTDLQFGATMGTSRTVEGASQELTRARNEVFRPR